MDIGQLIAMAASQAAQGIQTNTPMDRYAQFFSRLMQHASKWSAISSSGLRCRIRFRDDAGHNGRCSSPAIGVCLACEQSTCLGHAMISPDSGDILCFRCVAVVCRQSQAEDGNERQENNIPSCSCTDIGRINDDCTLHGRRQRDNREKRSNPHSVPPRSAPQRENVEHLRDAHLSVLGLDRSANWEQIKTAYKVLVAKHHPDRFQPSQRKEQEKKLKRLNIAFDWLRKNRANAA